MRAEIVLGGDHRGDDGGTIGTWIVATDLDGNQTWQLTREPLQMAGDDVKRVARGRGPSISDLAVRPDGLILAQGRSSFQLLFLLLDTGSCPD